MDEHICILFVPFSSEMHAQKGVPKRFGSVVPGGKFLGVIVKVVRQWLAGAGDGCGEQVINMILPKVNVRRTAAWYKESEEPDMSPTDSQART